jgi:hypothetical protein
MAEETQDALKMAGESSTRIGIRSAWMSAMTPV